MFKMIKNFFKKKEIVNKAEQKALLKKELLFRALNRYYAYQGTLEEVVKKELKKGSKFFTKFVDGEFRYFLGNKRSSMLVPTIVAEYFQSL